MVRKESRTLTLSLLTAVKTVVSEQHAQNSNLTAQNQQLWTLNNELERQTEELTRKRDQLNWTMGIILEFNYFPVYSYCPHKGENSILQLVGFPVGSKFWWNFDFYSVFTLFTVSFFGDTYV